MLSTLSSSCPCLFFCHSIRNGAKKLTFQGCQKCTWSLSKGLPQEEEKLDCLPELKYCFHPWNASLSSRKKPVWKNQPTNPWISDPWLSLEHIYQPTQVPRIWAYDLGHAGNIFFEMVPYLFQSVCFLRSLESSLIIIATMYWNLTFRQRIY